MEACRGRWALDIELAGSYGLTRGRGDGEMGLTGYEAWRRPTLRPAWHAEGWGWHTAC